MGWLLKMLGGSLGPYLAGAVGVLLALSMATAAVQGVRLKHAKADLVAARAALVNPATHKTWRNEAERAAGQLATCQGNEKTLTDTLGRQKDALTAMQQVSDRKLAQAATAAQAARAVAESARQQSGEILARQLLGATACERAEDARRHFLETVK